MMKRKTIGIFAAGGFLTLGLALGGALYAQETGGPPMAGMMGMMDMMGDCPMHSAMAESPSKVLEHREELGLSDQQVGRLTALRERTDANRQGAMERMRLLHDEIDAASSDAGFDEGALRAAFDRMGDMHTEMAVAMLRDRRAVREILTPAQRETLADIGPGMMGMHRMMGMMDGMGTMDGMGVMGMMDGMEDCPMMSPGRMGDAEGANAPRQPGTPLGQQR